MRWEDEAAAILKAELVRRDVSYKALANRLHEIGVRETEGSIRNKLSRGTFKFVFVLQCAKALGMKSVDVAVPVMDQAELSATK